VVRTTLKQTKESPAPQNHPRMVQRQRKPQHHRVPMSLPSRRHLLPVSLLPFKRQVFVSVTACKLLGFVTTAFQCGLEKVFPEPVTCGLVLGCGDTEA